VANDPKLEAYLAKAAAVKPKPLTEADVRDLQSRHEGCKKQFEELGAKLSEALALKDERAAKGVKAVLAENFKLRREIVLKLKAAKVAVSDPDVE